MFSKDLRKGAFLANLLGGCLLCLAITAACLTPGPVAAEPRSPAAKGGGPALTGREGPRLVETQTRCVLSPLLMPPTPAKIPGYTELDTSTNLHVTGGLQEIDLETYHLEVTGKVAHPLSITYDELRCMPRVEARPTLVCPGFFTDVATWAGTPLKHLIGLAQPAADATALRLFGADKYTASLSLQDAAAEGNFLAYEWEGKALPRLHGFPLRAVLPRAEGNQWVKWLIRIEVY
jgi:DMSO/TMAO reductase YedYZ molybdopterin-dependent catalytic subunit